jgi:toxin ParE1/3/4
VKPAKLRPQAKSDLRRQIGDYRRQASALVPQRLRDIAEQSLQLLEENPGMGSPLLGQEVGIENLRTWPLASFPVLWLYLERADHLDFVRLLGEQQDIAGILKSDL